jgi:uncharacterized protein
MAEKVGRNDPCPCGSGKKYKNCCFQKEQNKRGSLGGRKFTAKVLSGGGIINKPKLEVQEQVEAQEKGQAKPMVDYTTLMERSFGSALHSYEDKPPIPQDPSEYLVRDELDDSSKQ